MNENEQQYQPYPYPASYAEAHVAPAPPPRRRRRIARALVAGGMAVAVGASGALVIDNAVRSDSSASSGTTTALGDDQTGFGQFNWPDDAGTGSGSGTTSTATTRDATDDEEVGVVDINTVLNYGAGEAAGTGIVLTSDGEILTNNHVVEGSTSITVTIVSTGKTYQATVVGTDPTDDVAVLQLADASGLQTADLGDSDEVAVGDDVTAVGNAGGDGGSSTAAEGTVTALDQSITASDEGGESEQLSGMIQVSADIESGDSGGPLYSDDGEVIGINTAASTGRTAATVGYAIPIDTAVSIAERITSGEDSATIHQGYPAFLGVQLSSSNGSVTIAGVVDGSPAESAGLAAGDTITAIGGTAVSTATGLSDVLDGYDAGDKVKVTWTDTAGTSHTATVTLAEGPAD